MSSFMKIRAGGKILYVFILLSWEKLFSVLNFLGDIPVIRLKKRVNEDGVENSVYSKSPEW